MKLLKSSSLKTLKNFTAKLFFIGQVMIISVSLPALYYASVTHVEKDKTVETIIRTNKGKVIIKKAEAAVFNRSNNNSAKA